MTAFLSKTVSVAEGLSDVPDAQRRANWNDTFKNACAACAALDYSQTPMRHKKCPVPGCEHWFCPEHEEEHLRKFHNFVRREGSEPGKESTDAAE